MVADSGLGVGHPLVSVVIPCFNYGRFLSEALDSALAQDYPNVEVLVVDDGSTDETAIVAQSYAARGVRYHFQANAGPAAARNRGVGLADGEFVVLLDADNLLEPCHVSACYRLLLENPDCTFVYTQLRYFGSADLTSHFPPFSIRKLRKHNYIDMTTFIRSDVVRRFGFDPAYDAGLQDWDFYLTLVGHGYKGVLLDRPLLRYRVHDRPISIQNKFQADPELRHSTFKRLAWKHRRTFGWRSLTLFGRAWLHRYSFHPRLSLRRRQARGRAETESNV